MKRTELLQLAREAALAHGKGYKSKYLPYDQEGANDFMPHDWVLEAMERAVFVAEERATAQVAIVKQQDAVLSELAQLLNLPNGVLYAQLPTLVKALQGELAAAQMGTDGGVDQLDHPLFQAFHAAVCQATSGKGQRHGGAATPFYDQAWLTIAQAQGTGFLTGQAEKKLHEAGERVQKGEGKPGDEAWCREVLGALVYGGMAWLHATGRAKRGASADTGLTAEARDGLGGAFDGRTGTVMTAVGGVGTAATHGPLGAVGPDAR